MGELQPAGTGLCEPGPQGRWASSTKDCFTALLFYPKVARPACTLGSAGNAELVRRPGLHSGFLSGLGGGGGLPLVFFKKLIR